MCTMLYLQDAEQRKLKFRDTETFSQGETTCSKVVPEQDSGPTSPNILALVKGLQVKWKLCKKKIRLQQFPRKSDR